ncbi:MAG: hypothetical protein ACRDVD_04000 [Acidimicrobiia bacterium]
MDSDEHGVEIFERIPWESLEKPPNRRWALYLVAAAVVMGAVGLTVGRGIATPQAVPPSTVPPTTVAPVTSLPGLGPTTIPVASAPDIPTTWSEADLMAVPAQDLEDGAAALAEWYVVDYFTRDGSGADGRSFVEWSAVLDKRWLTASALEHTVVVRRLAAPGDEPYDRVPTEAWRVTTELVDEGWVVVEGPVEATPPEPAVDRASLDGSLPPEVSGRLDDVEVRGATEVAGRWLVEVDWTDAAGLSWVVRQWLEPEL